MITEFTDFPYFKVCSVCDTSFYYLATPSSEDCFCGGELRTATKEEEVEIINSFNNHNACIS